MSSYGDKSTGTPNNRLQRTVRYRIASKYIASRTPSGAGPVADAGGM